MNSENFQSTNEIRTLFTQAMSDMYQLEVPLYKQLLSLAASVNQETIEQSSSLSQSDKSLLDLEHHGAIRVGHKSELSLIRRLFGVMGMYPVDYYDLSVAGIPVHSTAFRALNKADLNESPFRVFCSLLRLDLIDDEQLREQSAEILSKRQIFPEELIKLIELSEKQGGLYSHQVNSFVNNALEVFRWHQEATVDKHTYDNLKASHGLVADIVSFKGPHINHLTPKILDIDACQALFTKNNIKAKATVEGPPKRNCPILLRQTSFIAIAEDIIFSDGNNASFDRNSDAKSGKHTARFGEVEQRGIALTPKGRKLYDQLLSQARNADKDSDYSMRLESAFSAFPDSYTEIRKQGLGYFQYSPISNNPIETTLKDKAIDIEALISAGHIQVLPITYEDFLPVSAAGIFTSNLSSDIQRTSDLNHTAVEREGANKMHFEDALGVEIINSFSLYETIEQDSINNSLQALGFKV